MCSVSNQHIKHIIIKSTRHFQNFRSYHRLPLINTSRIHYNFYQQSHKHFSSKPNEPTSSPLTPEPHHYTILNINENTSIDDIKKSYNNLLKQWHPDLYVSKPLTQQQQAQTKFLLIRESYEIIINHKEHLLNPTISSEKSAAQKQKSKTHKQTVSNTRYSYYSWGNKPQNSETETETKTHSNEQAEEEEEDTEEIRYSESYKQNKTWIGVTMEELYDWMIFLYARNPSWLQFFMISAAVFGIAQGIWHFIYPNINDADPDRIWNTFKFNNKHQGIGYQPSITGAMESTPSLVALQPHFKGHTVYGIDNEANKYKGDIEDFSDIKKDSKWKMFKKLNLNSTVNRGVFKKKQKKFDIKIVDSVEKNDEKECEFKENETVVKDVVKEKKKLLEYNDIPLELRASPSGVLMATYAIKNGEVSKLKENGQYDWSAVIEQYNKLNETK